MVTPAGFPEGHDQPPLPVLTVAGLKVNGEVRAAIGEYSQEYEPVHDRTAPTILPIPGTPCTRWCATAGVPPYDHVDRDPAAVARDRTLDPIAHHSWSEYVNGAGPSGAPVRDYQFPDPANPGSFVTVQGPDMKGDQMLWCVYNDANPNAHNNRAGRSAPLGVEIQQTTFASTARARSGTGVFSSSSSPTRAATRSTACT